MRTGPIRSAFLGVAAIALVSACSSSGATTAPAASAVPATEGVPGAMEATGAWARAMAPGATNSAVYLTLLNGTGTDDALVSASANIDATVEIHEVSMVSEAPMESAGMGGGMSSPAPMGSAGGGMMGMRPIEKLPLPAGTAVELKPGSYHIMLIGVKEPLKDGSTIEVTLTFEKAPPITLTVPVKMG